MRAKTLLLAATVAAMGSMAQATPARAQDKGNEKTIEARVVDQSCYLVHGLQGEEHKMCAEMCANQGVPLVFLAEDGNIYLPVSVPMPSEGHNPRLVDHAEEMVNVTGTVHRKAGTNSITVDRIERAS